MTRKTGRNRTDSGPSLRGKQGQVLKDLCLGNSIRQVARNNRISPNTIYEWLRRPAFAAALTEARRTAFFNTKDLIKILAESAVTRLAKTMEADDLAQARLAATTLLDKALLIEQREDFEARLIEIEKILGIRAPALLAREDGQGKDREPS